MHEAYFSIMKYHMQEYPTISGSLWGGIWQFHTILFGRIDL